MNRRLIFTAGGIVAAAAAVATAHGMYETAVAAGVGEWIAMTYPIMFDGQALVAYAATTRLRGAGRWYAWAVVILSAALSGLAQASYLGTGKQLHAPAELAFGIGYWPAIAWTVTAHLLYLLARAEPAPPAVVDESTDREFEELLDDHGLNRSWETAPPVEPDRPTEPRPVAPNRPASTENEAIIADLVEDVRCGKRLPSKTRLMRDHGMGSGRANRLLETAADQIGRPLKELQETMP